MDAWQKVEVASKILAAALCRFVWNLTSRPMLGDAR